MAPPAAELFLVVSQAPQPEAAYALDLSGANPVLWLRMQRPAGASTPATVRMQLLCNGKAAALTLTAVANAADGLDYAHTSLSGIGREELRELRLAFLLEWGGLVNGQPLRRERYLTGDNVGAFQEVSADPAAWGMIDLVAYRQAVADKRQTIALSLQQPVAGKLSVIIEDGQGRRVRNLAGGIARAAGKVVLNWDGTDDSGNLVAPGNYRWRAVHHPGIVPEYLGCYSNGGEKSLDPFGTNHGTFTAACADAERIFIAAPITEGGWAMIVLDDAGNWVKGFPELHGTGYDAVACASDGTYFYAIHEGPVPGQAEARSAKDKTRRVEQQYDFNLTRYRIAEGAPVSFKGGQSFAWLQKTFTRDRQAAAGLKGAVLLNGKLWVSSAYLQQVLIVDPATAVVERTLSLAQPGALATDGTQLYAASGDQVVMLDSQSGAAMPLLTGVTVNGMFFDSASGLLFLSDRATQTVKSFRDGKLVREYGEPGGAYAGTFRPLRLVNPAGLAVRGGKLWITESGRHSPKRLSMWDVKTGALLREKFGNAPYGGSGASFDPANSTRMVGMGCEWDVDLGANLEKCRSVFFLPQTRAEESAPVAGHLGGYYRFAMRYRYHREAGRTFLVGAGMIDLVSELLPDGALRDLAAFSSVELFRYGCNWRPPQAFEDDLAAHLAKNPVEKGSRGELQIRYLGVFWRDRNHNGLCDTGEFEFTPPNLAVGKTSWGNVAQGLALTVPLIEGNRKHGFVTLQPAGFAADGAPQYPGLLEAAGKASWIGELPVGLGRFAGIRAECVTDRSGNLILNSQPNMVSLDPAGKQRWFYPNRWVGVHGSHDAPLPEVGVMQGNLFFLGIAPLNDQNDVFILNGNHGRYFALTSDGFYLDEMFRDVRTGGARDANWVGGEPFGGFFGRRADGEYRLITGSNGYRIYRITGLDRLQRSAGEITVTPEQAQAAAREQAKRAAATAAKSHRMLTARGLAKPPAVDGNDKEWSALARIRWGGGDEGREPAQAAAGYDGQYLYLLFNIRDDSPWVNNGKDWQALFKTGDSVNLELATDAAADPTRRAPVPGDVRVLIAPYNGKNIVVLYRHRLAGGADKSRLVRFTSPWRSETVDEVKELTGAQVAVQKREDGYQLEVALPLSELGLSGAALLDKTLQADFGFILGDSAGTMNLRRSYWSNQATGLVNDVPGEIMSTPNLWGKMEFKP